MIREIFRTSMLRTVSALLFMIILFSACQKHQCPTYMTEDQVKEANKMAMGKNKKHNRLRRH